MHLPHTRIPHLKFRGTKNIPRSDCSLGGDLKCFDTFLDFSSLTSITFAVLDLIFNL
ncbi:hypothetical protein E2C01_043254 [Portunus trituberculatus]|uniref:Uncharacterized protein n=1 Tax=Portunus trituberculatus TaxID=210409 RepID=A0A5B7FSH2_PORTR|nr:hypothetical protein [Portunus trituberculatus]